MYRKFVFVHSILSLWSLNSIMIALVKFKFCQLRNFSYSLWQKSWISSFVASKGSSPIYANHFGVDSLVCKVLEQTLKVSLQPKKSRRVFISGIPLLLTRNRTLSSRVLDNSCSRYTSRIIYHVIFKWFKFLFFWKK